VRADLAELARLVPPPLGPVAPPPWHRSKTEFGLELPSDYRAFVDAYGGGELSKAGLGGPLLSVVTPCNAPSPHSSSAGFPALLEYQLGEAELFGEFDESDWDGPVYPFHPTPGGLVAWGQNMMGDAFFWLTQDPDPDRWPVLMWARGPVTTYRFDGGIVTFLLALLAGDHPASALLEGPGVHWIMHNDWLRRDLAVSAGPPA